MNDVTPVPRTPAETSATRYPWTGEPSGSRWIAEEATVLLALADAGGDLPAHLSVHLGETR